MSADGNWKITINTPMGAQVVEAAITTSGDTFTGTTSGQMGSQEVSGKVAGDTLTWSADITSPSDEARVHGHRGGRCHDRQRQAGYVRQRCPDRRPRLSYSLRLCADRMPSPATEGAFCCLGSSPGRGHVGEVAVGFPFRLDSRRVSLRRVLRRGAGRQIGNVARAVGKDVGRRHLHQ